MSRENWTEKQYEDTIRRIKNDIADSLNPTAIRANQKVHEAYSELVELENEYDNLIRGDFSAYSITAELTDNVARAIRWAGMADKGSIAAAITPEIIRLVRDIIMIKWSRNDIYSITDVEFLLNEMLRECGYIKTVSGDTTTDTGYVPGVGL